LVLALAGLAELFPAFHEAVGAPGRVGTDFRFKLERANGAVDPARRRHMNKVRGLATGGKPRKSGRWGAPANTEELRCRRGQ
jgi:hypothetical protein